MEVLRPETDEADDFDLDWQELVPAPTVWVVTPGLKIVLVTPLTMN
jgi:hypothetical protein